MTNHDEFDLPDDELFEPARDWTPDGDSDIDDEPDEFTLGVEITGIEGLKAKADLPLQPVDDSEPPAPRSWKEVWDRIHDSFRSLVVRLFDLPLQAVNTIHAGLRGIRGIAKLPMAVGEALTKSRETAVTREEKAQSELEDRTADALEPATTSQDHQAISRAGLSLPTVTQSLEKLEAIVMRFQAYGIAVRIQRLATGEYVIVAARPEGVDRGVQVASAALANLPGPTETSLSIENSSGEESVDDETISSESQLVDGERVRALRIATGQSQAQLAERCHVSPSTVSRIETGKSQHTTLRVLTRLATALGVKVDELIRSGS